MTLEERAREWLEKYGKPVFRHDGIDYSCITIITDLLAEVERLKNQTHIGPLYHHNAIKQANKDIHFLEGGISALKDENEHYYELLMEVKNKYPNETRHETALRYIKAAEAQIDMIAKTTNTLSDHREALEVGDE